MTYQDHPLASILPMMGQVELNELAADIQGNGLRAPITLLDNKILDGRNRYKACLMVNVEPRFRDFNGDGDPLDFIVSVNVKRRHLTTSQRAMIAAKLVNMPRGGDQSANLHSGKKTLGQAAQSLEVSRREVATAKKVLATAPKREIKAVERGQKTVTAVAKETKKRAEAKEQHFDKTNIPIPAEIYPDWQRAEAYNESLRTISKIKTSLETALEEKDVLFAEVNNTTVATLKNAYGDLKRVLPYAICSTCQGRNRTKCTLCRGRGWLSEFLYKTAVPESTRKIRERAAK